MFCTQFVQYFYDTFDKVGHDINSFIRCNYKVIFAKITAIDTLSSVGLEGVGGGGGG